METKAFSFHLITLAIALQGCSNTADLKTPEQHTLEGFYIYGHEVNSFKPCNSKEVFWVSNQKEINKELLAFYEKNTSKPYESIYIKIGVDFINKANDGFAQDYDKQIKINKIYLKRKTSKNDCL